MQVCHSRTFNILSYMPKRRIALSEPSIALLCSRLSVIVVTHEAFELELLRIRRLTIRNTGQYRVAIGGRSLFVLLGHRR